jgi:hypothetical protein
MTEVDSFEHAFVAVSYLLGRRGDLVLGLREPGAAARSAATLVTERSQGERARRLAAELVPIAAALDTRKLK